MTIVNPLPEDCRVELPERNSVLKPYCLGHGTLECFDLQASRRFYQDFLGLETVRHAISAMSVRLGMRFHIVCVEVGDQVHPCNVLNHWGLDVGSKLEVEQAHSKALELKENFGIRQVLDVQDMHGVYSFYLEDLDYNWWEIQYYANGFCHDDYFDFGDRY
ncbi:VOC family protein [Pseudomonas prosekii]|uniref:VOC family protein n=1 Tax=Pseudomonas prosekii TaxID=1148509 RepID=UPI0011EB1F8D|nr:VOC family protein [Pseudomonas prosekii]